MKVALHARVSTDDKNQDPETQLRQLCDCCQRQEWDGHDESQDHAPPCDQLRRVAWRRMMLDQAAAREFDLVLMFRLDRAFRSVLEGVQTLEGLKAWGVGFRSCSEPYIYTITPMGEAMFAISAAWAQLERSTKDERVKAGFARARAGGKSIGRPSLENLDLSGRGLKTLDALQSMPPLKGLNLHASEITDIGPIRHQPSLEYVNLSRNNITDISSLTDITNLESLHLGENPLSAESINTYIVELRTRGVEVHLD